MEGFWFRYGANYCNSQDDLGCIIRKFGKIVLLFFSLYEAHILNLQDSRSLVKGNLVRGQREWGTLLHYEVMIRRLHGLIAAPVK